MMKRKPIEMIKNKNTPLIKMEDELSTLVQFQENIMAQIIDRQDEAYADFLVNQIIAFMKENNVSTCFVLNKEELLDCLKEHNKLHCEILNLQSQLDQANEKLNEHNEYFKEFNCKDFKGFQDFISLFMLTPHEKQTLIKELQNQLNQANERLKGAIVPKFKIGQEVWAVSVLRLNNIDSFIITEICYCADYGLYYKTNLGINLYEYYFDVFTTLEEAEKKLQELRGGE